MKISQNIKTPYFLVDESRLKRNLAIIKSLKDRTGVKVLLAQKAFSSYYFYPLLAETLDGTSSSGLFEARLANEHFGKEIHVFAPAYREEEFGDLLKYADHFVFNSMAQLKKFAPAVIRCGKTTGLRINPECSTQHGGMYDPCAPSSRMGVKFEDFDASVLPLITGFHFHALCQQNADALKITLEAVTAKFGKYFSHLKWINFGGGHHLTRPDYDLDLLATTINDFKARYGLDVYLEPGEAIVLNAGFLVATVLDIVHNDIPIAILDASATCHMPDVLEMPFTPPVVGALKEGGHLVRLSSHTCLTGDHFGVYRLKSPPQVGDKIVFEDAALYTIVKTNTFNGISLPSIYARKEDGTDVLVKTFDYGYFKERLS
jgi:carboxynorspermidine decarboxylase